jgi:hypothetical protein
MSNERAKLSNFVGRFEKVQAAEEGKSLRALMLGAIRSPRRRAAIEMDRGGLGLFAMAPFIITVIRRRSSGPHRTPWPSHDSSNRYLYSRLETPRPELRIYRS